MIPGAPLSGTAGVLCLALAAALLPGDRHRRAAAAGLLILGLALAAWLAGSPPGATPTPPARLERGFVVGNAGLLLVGSVLVGWALANTPADRLRPWARLLGLSGLGPLGPVLISFIGASGIPRALASALGLALVGAALAVGISRIGASRPARLAGRRLAPAPVVAMLRGEPRGRPAAVLVVIGLLVALAGAHVAAVLLGVIVATWAAWLVSHAPGTRPLPVAPALTLLLLPAWWLMATIAGPVGLRIATLAQVPLSPAAELLITPSLLLAGWATAGLWPLQRQLPGALVAPAGALLLARVAHPLVPDGLEYWRPLTTPLMILGLWQAAAWGRWPLLVAGAGVLGVAGGPVDRTTASAILLATGLILSLGWAPDRSPRAITLLQAAAWPLVTWGGLGLLQGLLGGEVVYSTVGVLGLALIVIGGSLIPLTAGSILPVDTR